MADGQVFRLPRALEPGDVVRVIAPSGPFESPLVWRGLGWLAHRYRVRWSRGIFAQHGYLAGDDARRLAELQHALAEPDTAAVLCARGGYGLSRIAHRVDYTPMAENPKWVVGFSDITALHVELVARGIASLHGPNVTGLGRGDAAAREELVHHLEQPLARRSYALRPLTVGVGEGPLCGGNLALLHACAAAGRLSLPRGGILFIEDIGEQPYRLDRMLTSLIVGGHLSEVGGVVVGGLTACRPGRDGVRADRVVHECLAELAVPVADRLEAGHDVVNRPLVLGARHRLEVTATAATLSS